MVWIGVQDTIEFSFFELVNSKFMENFQREAVNPTFGKKYVEVISVILICDILFKLLLGIFTIYITQNN